MIRSPVDGLKVIQGTDVLSAISANYCNESKYGAYLGNLESYPVLLPKLF